MVSPLPSAVLPIWPRIVSSRTFSAIFRSPEDLSSEEDLFESFMIVGGFGGFVSSVGQNRDLWRRLERSSVLGKIYRDDTIRPVARRRETTRAAGIDR